MHRSLAGGLLLVAVFTAGLLGAAGGTLTTALLFCARAASMGAFAILYVYTPEARPCPAPSARLAASQLRFLWEKQQTYLGGAGKCG